MIDRITGWSLSALVPSLVVIALASGPLPSRAVDQSSTNRTAAGAAASGVAGAPEDGWGVDPSGGRRAAPSAPTAPATGLPTLMLDDATLEKIAPALPQIVNLAVLDPGLASQLVPDSWLDTAIESARLVAREKPRAQRGPMEPATWPVGPWSSAGSMATSIRELDPTAAAALFGALRPRLARRCEVSGAAAERCEQEMRVTLERLAAPVVAARLTGRDADPITDSQLEFARLGPQVVHPGRAKIAALRRAVWP